MLNENQQRIISEYQKHSDWYIKSFHGRVLPFAVQVYGVREMMKKFPWAQHFGGTYGLPDNMFTWFWKESEMKRVREEFIEHVLVEPSFLDEFERSFMSAWQQFTAAEAAFTQNYADGNIERIIEQLQELIAVEQGVCRYGYMNDAFLTEGRRDWLSERILAELPESTKNREAVLNDLAAPVAPSFVQEEAFDRCVIALQDEQQWDQLLRQHAAKWSWIENSYFESPQLDEEAFRGMVKQVRQDVDDLEHTIAEAKAAPTVKEERKRELAESLNLSDELLSLINLADRLSHITDLRKMGALRLNAQVWKVLHDLEELAGQPLDLLSWCVHDELQEIILNGRWEILRKRRETGILVLHYNADSIRVDGDEFIAIDRTPFIGALEDEDSVSGQVAYPGRVTATARVVRGRHDFRQFRDGDILITNQTTPEFVPLMKRASAVVTEQGGITCHAAIIAREFKIPCIIGAAAVMQIFNNGEQVTVDTELGEIQRVPS